jgi:hypothetical protein
MTESVAIQMTAMTQPASASRVAKLCLAKDG